MPQGDSSKSDSSYMYICLSLLYVRVVLWVIFFQCFPTAPQITYTFSNLTTHEDYKITKYQKLKL